MIADIKRWRWPGAFEVRRSPAREVEKRVLGAGPKRGVILNHDLPRRATRRVFRRATVTQAQKDLRESAVADDAA